MWSLGCLLFATGCALDSVRPSTVGAGRWLEVVTPHFVLNTDQLEPKALDTARALEEARASLLQLAWTGARNPPRGRVDVVVFRSSSDLNRYAGLDHPVAGFAARRNGERPLLSFHPGAGNSVPSVIVHELAHDLSAWFMPIQPAWFAEGFATYLETVSYDRSTHQALLGQPSADHVRWLQHTGVMISSERLFAASRPDHDDMRETLSFYSSSWLLVHYLLNRESERFGDFQRRLARLEEWRDAWQASFGEVSPQHLDARVVAHAERTEASSLTGPVRLEPFEPRLRLLSEAQRHGVLAMLASIRQPELAEQEARAALRLNPNELNALRVNFNLLEAAPQQARRELALRAVAAHPEHADAWWLLARAADSQDERDHALEQAQRLEPEHPGVALRIARRKLQNADARAALPLTQLAIRRSAPSSTALLLHVRALVGVRDCTGALRLQGTLERDLADRCASEVSSDCGEAQRAALRQWVAACNGAKPAPGFTALDDPLTCTDPRPASAQSEDDETPAAPAAPRPEASTPSGRLPPEQIRSIVRKKYPAFRACYERGLVGNADLQGRVTVHFVIERDGHVSKAAIADTDLPNCSVARCIRQGFTELQFPEPKGGLVTVSYPIALEPGDP